MCRVRWLRFLQSCRLKVWFLWRLAWCEGVFPCWVGWEWGEEAVLARGVGGREAAEAGM